MLGLRKLRDEACPRGHSLEYMTDKSPSELLEANASHDHIFRAEDVWCMACRAEDLHHRAHADLDKGLAGTSMDEAPGRYSIVRKIPNTD